MREKNLNLDEVKECESDAVEFINAILKQLSAEKKIRVMDIITGYVLADAQNLKSAI